MFIGPPIKEKRPIKNLKILLFLAPFIFKTKIVGIFNFPSLRYFGYCFPLWVFDIYCSTFVEIKGRRTSYFGSLDTTDNNLKAEKQNSSELANTFFCKALSIAMSGESFNFLDPRTVKWRPFETFAKLNGKDIVLAVFCRFSEYHSNVLTEMHNFGYFIVADS